MMRLEIRAHRPLWGSRAGPSLLPFFSFCLTPSHSFRSLSTSFLLSACLSVCLSVTFLCSVLSLASGSWSDCLSLHSTLVFQSTSPVPCLIPATPYFLHQPPSHPSLSVPLLFPPISSSFYPFPSISFSFCLSPLTPPDSPFLLLPCLCVTLSVPEP